MAAADQEVMTESIDFTKSLVKEIRGAWSMWIAGNKRGILDNLVMTPLDLAQNHKYVTRLIKRNESETNEHKEINLKIWSEYMDWLKSVESMDWANVLKVKRLFLLFLKDYIMYKREVYPGIKRHRRCAYDIFKDPKILKEYSMFFTNIHESSKLLDTALNDDDFPGEEALEYNRNVIKYSRLRPTDADITDLTETGSWKPIILAQIVSKEFNLQPFQKTDVARERKKHSERMHSLGYVIQQTCKGQIWIKKPVVTKLSK